MFFYEKNTTLDALNFIYNYPPQKLYICKPHFWVGCGLRQYCWSIKYVFSNRDRVYRTE